VALEQAVRNHPKRTLLATWALLVCGVIGAGFLASSNYFAANARSAAGFRANAASLSASVLTEVRRDEDFVVSQAAMVGAMPGITNTFYRRWMEGVGMAARYPGGLGSTFVARVPASGLHRFAVALARDPMAGLSAPAPAQYHPWPPGSRPEYCLMRIAYSVGRVTTDAVGMVPATFDFCAPLGSTSPFPALFAAATESGSVTVAPPISIYPGVFYVIAPVYRTGSLPSDLAQRQSKVAGWMMSSFSAAKTLGSAMGEVKGFGVKLAYSEPSATGSRRVASLVASLAPGKGAAQYSTTVGTVGSGRWSVTVVGEPVSGALGQALLGGLLVLGASILLFFSIRVLAFSRQRALALVDERTRELRYQALHDSLTGLPNRALVTDRAQQLLARAEREPIVPSVLFIDLDNFKDINDSFGHQRGDQLLKAVGERLAALVRPGDSVGRLGGDEFVVLVQGSPSDPGPGAVAQRVMEGLGEPFRLQGMEGVELTVEASIGVASGGPGQNTDELLRDADVALYQAKRGGKGRHVLFRPDMRLAVQDHLALEMDLRHAIEEGELFVEYQPTFDLGTLAITGVEALARWQHPTRGLVPPDQFIPIAEDSGLIANLGKYVLTRSCRQGAAWARAGHQLNILVNVSGYQLESEEFAAQVSEILRDSGLDASLLTLELTESVLMRDADSSVRRLQALKKLGLKVAIDDFGTGYSSLARLRVLPVDALKIDRSFVAGIVSSRQARTIVGSLVHLGNGLGLQVFAEGIEDEHQLAELERLGCEYGQGFYYSRPLRPEVLAELFHLGSWPASEVPAL
jgi:diguanylate cyclase (GGDEF)-like protein